MPDLNTQTRKDRRLAVFLIAPASLVVFIAMIVPLGYALVMSFFAYKVGAESQARFVFLDNYLMFFTDRLGLKSLLTTVIFSVGGTGAGTCHRHADRGAADEHPAAASRASCAPSTRSRSLISPIIISLIWSQMYDPSYGLVYYLLELVGLDRRSSAA